MNRIELCATAADPLAHFGERARTCYKSLVEQVSCRQHMDATTLGSRIVARPATVPVSVLAATLSPSPGFWSEDGDVTGRTHRLLPLLASD